MNKLASPGEIDDKINQMAQKIATKYGDEKPLFVCLLRGGAPFACKLMFAIAKVAPEFHPELTYMMVKTYGNERTARETRIVMDLPEKTDVVAGRIVMVLDDVLDKGSTASFVKKHLLSLRAKRVDLAVLVQKDIARDEFKAADFYAFTAGPEWLTGMGMDDTSVAKEGFRWLDEIRVIG